METKKEVSYKIVPVSEQVKIYKTLNQFLKDPEKMEHLEKFGIKKTILINLTLDFENSFIKLKKLCEFLETLKRNVTF